MSKLLNNLPIEDLTEENDYLGIIDKGQIIKTFLESNTHEFKDIKMFALYGEWGSGKSNLMKYLQKELKDSFNTYFFEAWQYESDDNLSLSLLEYLCYETSDSTDEALGEIVKVAAKLFRGFSKSMRISVPGLSIDGSKIVESLEEEPKETFYQLKKKFQKEFQSWENANTVKGKPKFNIIFIDDLDRCEPENVLNLLSALKLFFTYGEKTIFFCGVDKKAVNEAVKTKYNDLVKSNEYLEKIFDISFSIPRYDNLYKLIDYYFANLKINYDDSFLSEKLVTFFNSLEFVNPRKVKKVLNKFFLFMQIRENLPETHPYLEIFPNCIDDNKGTYFETILTIFFIIAIEFEPSVFDSIFDIKKKQRNFHSVMKANLAGQTLTYHNNNLELLVENNYPILPLTVFNSSNNYKALIFTFLPLDARITNSNLFDLSKFEKIRIDKNSLIYRFLLYLVRNKKMFENSSKFSVISLRTLKEIIERVI